MILIVGLGNPGPDYSHNRHNAGFMVIDCIIESLEKKSEYIKYNSSIVKTVIEEKEILLVKPLTYMNNSGSAISRLIRANPEGDIERMLVIYDDMDIEFGLVRLRKKGSAGGHNGMESVISSLGGIDFDRMRFGIGRPPGRMDPAKYVLSDFNKAESRELELYLNEARDTIKDYIYYGIDYCMNKYN